MKTLQHIYYENSQQNQIFEVKFFHNLILFEYA